MSGATVAFRALTTTTATATTITITITFERAVARSLASTKKPPVSQGLLRCYALLGALVLKEA